MNVNINLTPKKGFLKKIIIIGIFALFCFFLNEKVFALSVPSYFEEYSDYAVYCDIENICLEEDYQQYLTFYEFYEAYIDLTHKYNMVLTNDCENYPDSYINTCDYTTEIHFFSLPVYRNVAYNQGDYRIFYRDTLSNPESYSTYWILANMSHTSSVNYFHFRIGNNNPDSPYYDLPRASWSKIKDSNYNVKDFNTQEVIFNSTYNSDIELEPDYSDTSSSKSILDILKDTFLNIITIPAKIINGIGDFFNNLLEGIKSLFIPDFSLLEDSFKEQYDYINKKLGFLTYPIRVVVDFANRFYALSDSNSAVFKIPKLEVFNYTLYEGTSFDLMTLVNGNNNIKRVYNIYKIAVSGFIVLWLVQLAVKKEHEIFGGGSGVN